ncbi:MAG: DDE transposase, partial [Peptococcaceae bacterium]|nr:DDE transposase [Peptococcaceae bacterium]
MKETNKSQISLTDPESRLMKTHNGGFDVSYNVQVAVDASNHMVSDFEVTNDCNDKDLLYEGARMAKEALDADSIDAVVDNGYENKEEILKCLKEGIFPYVALQEGVEECEIILDYKESDI